VWIEVSTQIDLNGELHTEKASYGFPANSL
jgi:hypothetical protein